MIRFRMAIVRSIALLALSFSGAHVAADDALIAVATNFAGVAAQLEAGFESGGEHRVTIASGSTGKHFAQIVNGAPYDAFLAADQARPRLLLESGEAVAGSGFVYATGRLALWRPGRRIHDEDVRAVLRRADFRTLAIANPALAPYGLAAREALQNLGMWQSLEAKIVMGENVGQAHTLIATGNAEIGFTSLSQVISPRREAQGATWEIPASWHDPIRQQAVLLTHGADNPAASAFLRYLKSDGARNLIRSSGYGVD